MKILKRIFGDDRERGKIVDGAVKGLDKIFFTQEERAEASQKLNEWYLRWLEATAPQNLARRLIALVVTAIWALILLVGLVAYPFNTGFSEFAFNTLDEVVNQPFSIIIGFYFLSHITRQFRKPDKGKDDADTTT